MKPMNKEKTISMTRLLPLAMAALALLLTASAYAATPGIQGTAFTLTARAAFLTQPDGQAIYSWGYGCTSNVPGSAKFMPEAISGTFCNEMQVPGPTLIVTEGVQFTVTLKNALPMGAGNTSILFPGLQVQSVSGGVAGLLTTEAAPNGSVTYTLVANSPGTRAYYSGTQGDLQVEMGMYGAVVVLPANVPSVCTTGLPLTKPGGNAAAQSHWKETDFRLADSAYDDPNTCYDREYLFQFSEIDPRIHRQAEEQLATIANCTPSDTNVCPTSLNVATEPYHPAYYMINGRSMPDNMDPNYAIQYPHQPYNGNPHMHPGELTLLRVIGQGRWQHPFHEHGNHVRILGRDGNLILAPDGKALAGPLLFTTTTTPGLAMDGIFYWSGKGLNWDAYGHHPGSNDPNAVLPCMPDANGYNTGDPTAINYFEWCQDHNKPVEKAPFGDVSGGGPVTLPDPNILTNGAWFGGSPYLGPDATTRATFGSCSGANTLSSCGTSGTTPPSGTIANSPSSEAGFAFMWHSHNEREITTNNIFPGGMLMMMLVDSREFVIDESF
jgi:FtsP/CotA-like multicopper oxidase with cupredoxin domain